MSDVAIRMEHVYKKFRKGETYNSLRDLLARSDRKNVSTARNSRRRQEGILGRAGSLV